jgi:hypothetical protein
MFDICQAHLQLESDYNVGGILLERPSNRRRHASTGFQLHRMKFSDRMRWVTIVPDASIDSLHGDDDDVRDVYLINVLKWGLPMDDEMREFIKSRYAPDFLGKFDSWKAQTPTSDVPKENSP